MGRATWTIYKKELAATLQNPGVYAVAGLFFLMVSSLTVQALIRYAIRQGSATAATVSTAADFTQMMSASSFGTVSILFIFVIPIITMRAFAEERRSGAMELIHSWPIHDWELILGKFFSLASVVLVFELIMGLYVLMFYLLSEPDTGVIISAALGLFLLSLAYVSFGLFASSLTENQIIAAIITFAGLFMFAIIQNLVTDTSTVLAGFCNSASITVHYSRFIEGGIQGADFAYFIFFTVFWLFMTARSLESRRLF